MKAVFGWGRPLYDEELARAILELRGIEHPNASTVQRIAIQLRRRTLTIRILSVLTVAMVLVVVLLKLR